MRQVIILMQIHTLVKLCVKSDVKRITFALLIFTHVKESMIG